MTEIQIEKIFPYTKIVNPFKIQTNVPEHWLTEDYVLVKFHDVDGTKFSCIDKYLPCPLCELGHERFIYKHFTIYRTTENLHSVINLKPPHQERETKLGAYVAAVDKRYGNPYGSKVFKLMEVQPVDILLNSNGWFAQLKAELKLMTALCE